jgi:quinol monooxygenase YgiN
MAKPLQIVATMVAKKGQESAARRLLRPAVKKFRDEPGCEGYILLEDKKHSGRFMTYETWIDDTALAEHMKSPSMRALAPKLKPMLKSPIRQDFLEVVIQLD